MNSVELEIAKRTLRVSQEARAFVPFYRNVLKPILEDSIIRFMSGDDERSDRELLQCRAFAKVVRDIEILLNRVIIRGESVEKVIKEYMSQQKSEG